MCTRRYGIRAPLICKPIFADAYRFDFSKTFHCDAINGIKTNGKLWAFRNIGKWEMEGEKGFKFRNEIETKQVHKMILEIYTSYTIWQWLRINSENWFHCCWSSSNDSWIMPMKLCACVNVCERCSYVTMCVIESRLQLQQMLMIVVRFVSIVLPQIMCFIVTDLMLHSKDSIVEPYSYSYPFVTVRLSFDYLIGWIISYVRNSK